MKYRNFLDVPVSEIGLGTWQLGSADWGNVDEEKALAILAEFVRLGGNFIDTADVYGMGVSERIIGKFLKSTSSEVFVASKIGRRHDAPNGWPQNFTYDYMRRQVEDSLMHLGVEQLFLEQLHCIPGTELQKDTIFGHLRQLQSEGLIKHWGVSVETSEEALWCLEQDGLASLQLIFNLFRQHVAHEVFEKAKEKNVAIIVRVPLASGLLTGKFNADTVFAPKDHRNYNANGEAFNAGETFSGVDFKEGLAAAKQLFAHYPDNRYPQWAIRWILDHPQVTTVIPGASRIDQVKSNMEAADLSPLSSSAHTELRAIYDRDIRPAIRGHY